MFIIICNVTRCINVSSLLSIIEIDNWKTRKHGIYERTLEIKFHQYVVEIVISTSGIDESR